MPVRGPRQKSLARRLFVGAALWSLVVLVAAAFGLSALYRAQALRILENELDATLTSLTRAVDADADGAIGVVEQFLPSDQRYLTPLSGQYWSVVALDPAGQVIEDQRSRSLWDGDVPWPAGRISEVTADLGETFYADSTGPVGDRIRVAAKAVMVPSRETPVLLLAAVDRRLADESAERFLWTLFLAMGVLAAGLLLALVIQVRVGLAPLHRIERDLADIREGRKTALEGEYPREVTPLRDELNKLLEHNRDVVERARTHVGNLAHALKTPIAVLMNEAKGEDDFARLVRRQTDSMNSNVQHYLKRAQAAARAEVLGSRTDLAPVLDDLARLLNRLFGRDGVTVVADCTEALACRGERQDLEDMVGNLMENACKFARSVVEVEARRDGAQVFVTVDDDGPGLTPDERLQAVQRGVRLDETAPGTGLGLSIVKELAEMHGGSLELCDSELGGLRACLRLPVA